MSVSKVQMVLSYFGSDTMSAVCLVDSEQVYEQVV